MKLSWRPPAGRHALHLAVVAAAMGALYGEALLHVATRVFGDPGGGDPALVLMQLKWPADYLLGRTPGYLKGLASFPIYYPYANSFSLSDNMLGNQPIWFPIYALTGNPVLATNLWVLACSVLNFLCFSWYLDSCSLLVFMERRRRRRLAMLGGVFFAFAGFRLDNHFHLQLLPQFWTPLALLFLDRAMIAKGRRYFLLLAASLAMQWLSGTYLGLMAFLLIAAAAAIYLAVSPARAVLIVGFAVSILGAVVLILPVLVGNVRAIAMGLSYTKDLAAAYGAGLAGFVGTVPWNHAPVALGICSPSHSSMSLFPGIALSLLMVSSCAAAAIVRPRSLVLWSSAIIATVFLVLATGEPHLVRLLPLYAVVRVPARLALAALVPGLLFVVCVLYRIVPARGITPVVTVALALLGVELLWREVPSRAFPGAPDPEFQRVLADNAFRPLLLLPQTVGSLHSLERVRMSQMHMEMLCHAWVPGLAGRSGPRPQFVNAVTVHSLDMRSVEGDAEAFVERARNLGYAGIAVIDELDDGYCAALSAVLGQPRLGHRYSYFPLYADPRDAHPPQRLDAGKGAAAAVAEGRFTVDIARLDPGSIRVTLRTKEALFGVVQTRRVAKVPYRLVSPMNETRYGMAEIVMDSVTDRPVLAFTLAVPAEPGWSLALADSSYWIPPLRPRE